MKRWAMWLLCGVVLAGCLSTRPEQWGASGEDPTLKRAIYECKSDAMGVSARANAFGGAVMPIVGGFQARNVFNECMESRGYKRQ